MMKKTIALVLSLMLLLSLAGCKSLVSGGAPTNDATTAVGSTPTPASATVKPTTGNSLLDKASKLLSAKGREYDKLYTVEMNQTHATAFFDFTITESAKVDELEEYTPSTDGNVFLTAQVTVKNTFGEPIPVGNYDFYILWNGGEDVGYSAFFEGMYPDDVELADGETVSGTLVFDIPPDAKDVMIGYTEIWDDDFEGSIYLVSIPD